jgi:ElaB/YqjD/DUF883 family membrane-anchored ribosome-binding protein
MNLHANRLDIPQNQPTNMIRNRENSAKPSKELVSLLKDIVNPRNLVMLLTVLKSFGSADALPFTRLRAPSTKTGDTHFPLFNHQRSLLSSPLCDGRSLPTQNDQWLSKEFSDILKIPRIASSNPYDPSCVQPFNHALNDIQNGRQVPLSELTTIKTGANYNCEENDQISSHIDQMRPYVANYTQGHRLPLLQDTITPCQSPQLVTLQDTNGNLKDILPLATFDVTTNDGVTHPYHLLPGDIFDSSAFTDGDMVLMGPNQNYLGRFHDNTFYTPSNEAIPIGITPSESSGGLRIETTTQLPNPNFEFAPSLLELLATASTLMVKASVPSTATNSQTTSLQPSATPDVTTPSPISPPPEPVTEFIQMLEDTINNPSPNTSPTLTQKIAELTATFGDCNLDLPTLQNAMSLLTILVRTDGVARVFDSPTISEPFRNLLDTILNSLKKNLYTFIETAIANSQTYMDTVIALSLSLEQMNTAPDQLTPLLEGLRDQISAEVTVMMQNRASHIADNGLDNISSLQAFLHPLLRLLNQSQLPDTILQALSRITQTVTTTIIRALDKELMEESIHTDSISQFIRFVRESIPDFSHETFENTALQSLRDSMTQLRHTILNHIIAHINDTGTPPDHIKKLINVLNPSELNAFIHDTITTSKASVFIQFIQRLNQFAADPAWARGIQDHIAHQINQEIIHATQNLGTTIIDNTQTLMQLLGTIRTIQAAASTFNDSLNDTATHLINKLKETLPQLIAQATNLANSQTIDLQPLFNTIHAIQHIVVGVNESSINDAFRLFQNTILSKINTLFSHHNFSDDNLATLAMLLNGLNMLQYGLTTDNPDFIQFSNLQQRVLESIGEKISNISSSIQSDIHSRINELAKTLKTLSDIAFDERQAQLSHRVTELENTIRLQLNKTIQQAILQLGQHSSQDILPSILSAIFKTIDQFFTENSSGRIAMAAYYDTFFKIISNLNSGPQNSPELQNNIDSIRSALSDANARIQGLGTALATNNAGIQGLGAVLADNNARIQGLGMALATNNAGIQGLGTALNNFAELSQSRNSENINLTESKFKEFSDTMNQQIAALPQSISDALKDQIANIKSEIEAQFKNTSDAFASKGDDINNKINNILKIVFAVFGSALALYCLKEMVACYSRQNNRDSRLENNHNNPLEPVSLHMGGAHPYVVETRFMLTQTTEPTTGRISPNGSSDSLPQNEYSRRRPRLGLTRASSDTEHRDLHSRVDSLMQNTYSIPSPISLDTYFSKQSHTQNSPQNDCSPRQPRLGLTRELSVTEHRDLHSRADSLMQNTCSISGPRDLSTYFSKRSHPQNPPQSTVKTPHRDGRPDYNEPRNDFANPDILLPEGPVKQRVRVLDNQNRAR